MSGLVLDLFAGRRLDEARCRSACTPSGSSGTTRRAGRAGRQGTHACAPTSRRCRLSRCAGRSPGSSLHRRARRQHGRAAERAATLCLNSRTRWRRSGPARRPPRCVRRPRHPLGARVGARPVRPRPPARVAGAGAGPRRAAHLAGVRRRPADARLQRVGRRAEQRRLRRPPDPAARHPIASRVRTVQPPAPTHTKGGEEADLFGDQLNPWVSMAQALGWGMGDRPYFAVAGGTAAGGADPAMVGGSGARKSLDAARASADWVERGKTEPAPTIVTTRRSSEGLLIGRQLPPGEESRAVGGWHYVNGTRRTPPSDPLPSPPRP